MTTAMIAARRCRRLTSVVRTLILALIPVFAWVVLAAAATVTPSNRVTSYLVVRNQPSGDGQEVGRLQPGEKAETVESVPRWLKVRLSDGTVGYVSKAWVEEVEDSSPPVAHAPTPSRGSPTPA